MVLTVKHRCGVPMTAKYYHRLRVFMIMSYFGLTVNSKAYFWLKIRLFLTKKLFLQTKYLTPVYRSETLLQKRHGAVETGFVA